MIGGPSATAQSPPFTDEMKQELGSANWIPADASYFSASYRVGEQWQAFLNSNAFRQLQIMPAVQFGLMQMRQHPKYQQFQAALTSNPVFQETLALAQDMFSEEVFLYVDSRGSIFLSALGSLYYEVYFNSFVEGAYRGDVDGEGQPELMNSIFETLVSYKDELQLPGVVIGFKLQTPDKAQRLLDLYMTDVRGAIPFPIQDMRIGAHSYYSLRLESNMLLPEEKIGEFYVDLRNKGIREDLLKSLIDLARTRTLSLTVGLRDEYLLISLGADNSHLEQLGVGQSLADSDQIEPIKTHFRDNLTSLVYVHPALTGTGKMNVEDIVEGLSELGKNEDVKAKLPKGLLPRAKQDLRVLLEEFNQQLPEPTPYLKSSFLNRGYESFTFSASYPGRLDSSEPLRILSHAGPSPLFAHASHAPSSEHTYERCAHWVQVLYGYFQDYVVPEIPLEDIDDFNKFQFTILPFIEKLHVTTKNLLIPSIDGCPSIFVVDGGGKVTALPEPDGPLARPVRFPRLAIACELNDSESLVDAFSSYRQSINALISDIAALDNSTDSEIYQLPAPDSRTFGEGTLYTYPLPSWFDPAILDNDFEPHAYVSQDRMVLSLSPSQTLLMMEESEFASSEVVDMKAPSGSATWFDIKALVQLIADDIDIVVEELAAQEEIEPMPAGMIRYHIMTIGKSLGAMRSYQSRTYVEGEYQVTHSWLHLEDIPE